MNKKISLGAAVSFMAIVAALTFTITMIFSRSTFNDKVINVKEREEEYQRIAEVDHLIRQNALQDINEKTFVDSLSEGMINGLSDPYADYYDAESYQKIMKIMSNDLSDAGAELVLDDSGYARVRTVYPESPAEVSGLQAGDLIISVNGDPVRTDSVILMKAALAGESGEVLNVSYRRDGAEASCNVALKKYSSPVVIYELREDTNAYIRISNFTKPAIAQFRTAINQMDEDQATGLIIDLRNTADGIPESACEIADLLLPTGDLMSVTYKDGTTKLLYSSGPQSVKIPAVVLINSKTQYAAELLAANLSDYGFAKLVGTTTAGQGVVQSFYRLKDGSGLTLSDGYYSSAIRANFNQVGVVPDYESTLSADDEKNYRYGALDPEQDMQLKKAIEVLESQK